MQHYTKRVAEHSTALALSDMSAQCTHEHWWRNGTRLTGDGIHQIMTCSRCRISRTVGGRDSRETKLRVLAELYKSKLTVRQAAQRSGYAFETVQKAFRLFRTIRPLFCGCGRPHIHFGWCRFRRDASPEQAYKVGRGKRKL